MKIVFFGSGEIAVESLKVLIKNNYELLCVVTSPDARKGRYLASASTSIKQFALGKNLKVFQPSNLTSSEIQESIRNLKPDIFVVFSYGKILPKEVLRIPKLLAINIHASLLPKYRGAAPINYTLINGEKKTGITVIRMNEKLDEGDIVLKKEVEIDYFDNAMTLQNKLSVLASEALLEALTKICNSSVSFSKQDQNQATYAPKLKKEDGKINWNKSANQIRNLVRGCYRWPGAFALFSKKVVKIWEVEVIKTIRGESRYKPGEIISLDKDGITVAAKERTVLIKELQVSSGKRLKAWQFIQGHKFNKGEILE